MAYVARVDRRAATRGIVCAALVIAIGSALSGCGTGVDARDARTATERFYRAVQQRDGAVACAQLSLDARAQLVKDEGGRCADAVLKLSLRGKRATVVRVYATSAQVVLAGGDTVFLGDTRQGWRIEAVGCRARHGGPYECEEQS